MDAASVQFGQYPPARRTLLHLSDTHLLAGNRPLGGRYDTAANLRRTLEAVERARHPSRRHRLHRRPHRPRRARGVPRAARGRRARRRAARRAGRSGSPATTTSARRCAATCSASSRREEPVTACGTSAACASSRSTRRVPGWHHGDLDDAQLDWLRGILATPAPLGTILAMHHPPLPSHIPLFDILELRDQGRLAEVIAGTDVRAILAGPPALLDERHVRRHPGERRRRDLLHDEPRAPRGRGQRHGCRAVVPPRARLRRHDHPRRRPRRRRADRRLLLGGVGRADGGADARRSGSRRSRASPPTP